MSDSPLPDIGFKNKMTLVGTTLKNLGLGPKKSKKSDQKTGAKYFREPGSHLGPVGPWITSGYMKLPRVTNSLLKPNS